LHTAGNQKLDGKTWEQGYQQCMYMYKPRP